MKKTFFEKNKTKNSSSFGERLENFFGNNLVFFQGVAIFTFLGFGIYIFLNNRREVAHNKVKEDMWKAEYALKSGNDDLAINGNEWVVGLLEIIEKNDKYREAHRARYLVAEAYYNDERYDEAIEILEGVSDDYKELKQFCYGLLGDIYCNQQEYELALEAMEKAATILPNELISPRFLIKKANIYEEGTEQYDKAYECYERIWNLYPKSRLVNEAKKHAQRLEILSSNI